MAFSNVVYTGDGVQQQFAITFPFLDRDHVSATVDGNTAAFQFISDGLITFTTAPANGSVIQITRLTPRTRLVDFTNGTVQDAEDFDRDSNQLLFVAQEALDSSESQLSRTPISDDNRLFVNIDLNGFKLFNSARASDPLDVATLQDVTDSIANIQFPVASTEVAGIVETATVAEVLGGVDNTRYVTPAGLSAFGAQEIPDKATTQEAVAGTNDTDFVTPAGVLASINANAPTGSGGSGGSFSPAVGTVQESYVSPGDGYLELNNGSFDPVAYPELAQVFPTGNDNAAAVEGSSVTFNNLQQSISGDEAGDRYANTNNPFSVTAFGSTSSSSTYEFIGVTSVSGNSGGPIYFDENGVNQASITTGQSGSFREIRSEGDLVVIYDRISDRPAQLSTDGGATYNVQLPRASNSTSHRYSDVCILNGVIYVMSNGSSSSFISIYKISADFQSIDEICRVNNAGTDNVLIVDREREVIYLKDEIEVNAREKAMVITGFKQDSNNDLFEFSSIVSRDSDISSIKSSVEFAYNPHRSLIVFVDAATYQTNFQINTFNPQTGERDGFFIDKSYKPSLGNLTEITWIGGDDYLVNFLEVPSSTQFIKTLHKVTLTPGSKGYVLSASDIFGKAGEYGQFQTRPHYNEQADKVITFGAGFDALATNSSAASQNPNNFEDVDSHDVCITTLSRDTTATLLPHTNNIASGSRQIKKYIKAET